MIDILSKRYLYFAVSLLVIVPGLILLAIGGLPLSIDFTGGSLLEIQFEAGKTPETAELVNLYEKAGIDDAQITTTESGALQIRSSFLTNEIRDSILSAMKKTSGSEVTVVRFDSVGPSIGKQVASRAALAVTVAALAVVIYITAAFRKVPNAFRYGVCAIIAMVHDVAVVFSVVGIGAKTGLRKTRQPLHRPDPAAFDQHPVDDRGIPPAGAGVVRRHHPAGILRHPARRSLQRDLLLDLCRGSHPGLVGKTRMDHLVQAQGNRRVTIRLQKGHRKVSLFDSRNKARKDE